MRNKIGVFAGVILFLLVIMNYRTISLALQDIVSAGASFLLVLGLFIPVGIVGYFLDRGFKGKK